VVVPALAGVLAGAACSSGDDDLDVAGFAGAYTVTMVVGDAISDPSAHPSLLLERGSSFTEQWVLECDASTCTLRRPDGGAVLGDLDGLRLAPPVPPPGEDPVESLAGETVGVRPEPDVAEPGPCAGSAAERWTVRVEVARTEAVLSGSVIRTPDSLLVAVGDADCYGLDLTLGLSGVRR
jgi:hypothetical protein